MKITSPFLLLALFLLPQAALASDANKDGEKLYKKLCSSCHGATGGMDMNKRLAPPVAAIRLHYMPYHPVKASFVTAVADWIEKQDADKSLMLGAIRKFKIMPPIPIVREDAEKIASYIYDGDIEILDGFKEHVAHMHGKKPIIKINKPD